MNEKLTNGPLPDPEANVEKNPDTVPPPAVPPAPAPKKAVALTADEAIEQAVGIVVEKFGREHPALFAAIKNRIGNPVAFIMESLKHDESYAALVAETEDHVFDGEMVQIVVAGALKMLNTLASSGTFAVMLG